MKINKSVSIERHRRVWELRQKCWTQERIAQELNISQQCVSKILYRLNKKFRERHEEYVDQVKGEQVSQLEYIADEAMQAWERSKEASKVVKKRQSVVDGVALNSAEQIQEARDQDGDPRYLMTAMKAKEDIRKIVGADAPIKNELTGKDGKPVQIDYDTTRDRLLARLLKDENVERGSEEPHSEPTG